MQKTSSHKRFMSRSSQMVCSKQCASGTTFIDKCKNKLFWASSRFLCISPNTYNVSDISHNSNGFWTDFESINTFGRETFCVLGAILSESLNHDNESSGMPSSCSSIQKRHSVDCILQMENIYSNPGLFSLFHEVKSTISFELKAANVFLLRGDTSAVFRALIIPNPQSITIIVVQKLFEIRRL